MKIFTKILLLLPLLIALGLALHFEIFNNFLPFRNLDKNSVLSINTRRGNARVWINGQDYGPTPQSISNLPDGDYLIELERDSEASIYPRQSFYIELHRNTEAIVDIELAPHDFKSGHILYYSPTARTLQKTGSLTIRSNVNNYEVNVGGTRISEDELVNYKLDPKEYDVEVKAKGYEPLEFPIIIREGYNLNIRVYLLPIPVEL